MLPDGLLYRTIWEVVRGNCLEKVKNTWQGIGRTICLSPSIVGQLLPIRSTIYQLVNQSLTRANQEMSENTVSIKKAFAACLCSSYDEPLFSNHRSLLSLVVTPKACPCSQDVISPTNVYSALKLGKISLQDHTVMRIHLPHRVAYYESSTNCRIPQWNWLNNVCFINRVGNT